jgi:ElaB/YqjD/DUF883 family membrane-anchored ribosome-binding protein
MSFFTGLFGTKVDEITTADVCQEFVDKLDNVVKTQTDAKVAAENTQKELESELSNTKDKVAKHSKEVENANKATGKLKEFFGVVES